MNPRRQLVDAASMSVRTVRTEALARVRQLVASGRAREIRLRARLSLGEIAADVGVTPTAVWRWELAGEPNQNGDERPNGRMPTGAAALRYLRVLDRLGSHVNDEQVNEEKEVAND